MPGVPSQVARAGVWVDEMSGLARDVGGAAALAAAVAAASPAGRAASGKLAEGLRALGLTSVGALLEHLPRNSREARTVAALKAGEQATVAVQVRRIGARAVRRRGMKPLVEATVFDGTGSMRATFFNQPWLAQRYEPGTRLVLHGKTTERGTFNVAHHAREGICNADLTNAHADRRMRRARSPTIRRLRA